MSPNLKPRRMPCLTHALTRQPVAVEASGSAARTCPEESASRSRANTVRAVSRSAAGPASTSDLISCSSISSSSAWCSVLCLGAAQGLHQSAFEQAERLEHVHYLFLRLCFWRDHRQPVHFFE